MAEKTSTEGSPALQGLVRQRFTPEGKAERVAKALSALHQDQPIKLSREQWRWIAEDANVEDQS